ncbi:PREDICTED: uncharacterized protein LOC108609395 [Drosophila arizonae]|uniref:Uncharacterized protein LOC108609395 n=1 Tax=Drosophila arizonae TaxID=7263 RepID=A0ABM1NNU2_DROAR|nr:PREDICTED: uncharacterized protein LOC108609395 [Drosophila arizonae]
MFDRLSVPEAAIAKHLEPWEKIKWRDDQLHTIYNDWGTYFSRNAKLNLGTKYFDAALKLSPENINSLLKRSQVKRARAWPMEGLADAMRSKAIFKRDNPRGSSREIDLEICDALIESNKFEEAMRFACSNMKDLTYSHALAMEKRIFLINRIVSDMLSTETESSVYRLITSMMKDIATQPKDVKSDCDVLSIVQKQPKILSPLEKKRLERRFKTFTQAYVNNSWMDVTFLKNLRDNPNLLLKQSVQSSEYLQNLTNERYHTLRNFTKMLHARQPMYSKKCPNRELSRKFQEENFFRIQNQTRRNMFKTLQNIRTLIRRNDLAKLTKFVANVMDSYVAIKTHRVMPWKFEFINEVFNYLGLARINEYKISNIYKSMGRSNLLDLFRISHHVSNVTNVITNDLGQIKREKFEDTKAVLKHRMDQFERRLRFAKYTIERCYLYHEAAQAHLNNHSFDKCCQLARKAMDEAEKGGHYVWGALSALIACKAHTVLGKVEKQKQMLNEAFRYAKQLQNIDLILFIDICLRVNNEEMELKTALTYEGCGRRRLRRLMTSLDTSCDNSIYTNSNSFAPEPSTDNFKE